MHGRLGFYYRLQSELRRRVASDQAEDGKGAIGRKPTVTELIMFIRLVALVGGMILAVSLVMSSIQ